MKFNINKIANNIPNYNLEELINHPVSIYLMKLNSLKSRRTMQSNLALAVKVLNPANDVLKFNWQLLSESLIIMMLNAIAKNHSPATVNATLSALKGVAKALWRQKVLSSEDFAAINDIKRFRGKRESRGRMLERDEISRLFNYLDASASPRNARNAAICSLLLGCGLRRSEIITLSLADFDFTDHSFIVTGKGNKEARCFLPEDCCKRVREWLEYRGTDAGPMICTIDKNGEIYPDKGLTDQRIYAIIKDLCNKLNFKNFSPHDLRRTYGSYLLDLGVDLVTVRDLMRHSSVSTTQIYDKRDDERKRKASGKVDFAA